MTKRFLSTAYSLFSLMTLTPFFPLVACPLRVLGIL